MDLFIKNYNENIINYDYANTQVQFKGRTDKKFVKEISDDIFKAASAAITAAGVAALGIKAKQEQNTGGSDETPTEPKREQKLVKRGYFANEILNVNIHTVDWHIQQDHIIADENNMIDINDPFNKQFIENYQKGKKVKFEVYRYTPETYEKLQRRLGKNLPLDYCLKHGLLFADESGEIRTDGGSNQEFLKQIDSGKVDYKTFFMSQEEYAKYLTIAKISVSRAVGDGRIKVDKDTQRIDINDPVNLEFKKKVDSAIEDAKERGLQRPLSFSDKKPKSKQKDIVRIPNKLTVKEFAEKLGYNKSSGVYYHARYGHIIVENGMVDISVEPNKSFYEMKLKGQLKPQPAKKQESASEKENNSNIKTQSYVAKEILGITPQSLVHHIKSGHLVTTQDGRIDISDERNKFFLENHKKGVILYPKRPVKPSEKPKKAEPEEVIINPNYVSIKDLTYITGLTPWPISMHIKRGRLIKEKDGIDVTNPTNRYFINKYEENGIEKLESMSSVELEKLSERFENRLRSLLSKNIYIQAQNARNKSEEDFEIFVKNTVYSLFRVEELTEKELSFIEKTIKNIIKTRIDDKTKPVDFSDIKDFKLSGVIELGYNLNVIDKLIDLKLAGTASGGSKKILKDLKFFKHPPISLKMKLSDFLKDNSIIAKWKVIFARIQDRKLQDIDKLSVDELKLKLIELYNSEKISNNKELSGIVEFMYGYDYAEESEINILKSFVKELIKYNEDFSNKSEFSKEIMEEAKKLEERFKNNESKKQEHYENVKKQLEACKNYLYEQGMNVAADICYKYIPMFVEDNENLSNASYIITLVNLLKEEIVLDEDFVKTHTEEEQNAEKIKLEKLRKKEVLYSLLGFDAEKSNPEILDDANKFAVSRYGKKDIISIGEYAYILNHINSFDFSSYPKFSYDFLYQNCEMKNTELAIILSKLNEWSELPEEEKHRFLSVYTRFSKKIDSVERNLLNDYLNNYYKNFDTVIIATGWKDKKIKIPAVMTQRVKEKEMFKEISESELIEYIEEFESCMGRIVGKTDTFGIKEYEGKRKKDRRTHEVKVSYPARLYCNKGKEDIFIFDDFEYNAHQGSKT